MFLVFYCLFYYVLKSKYFSLASVAHIFIIIIFNVLCVCLFWNFELNWIWIFYYNFSLGYWFFIWAILIYLLFKLHSRKLKHMDCLLHHSRCFFLFFSVKTFIDRCDRNSYQNNFGNGYCKMGQEKRLVILIEKLDLQETTRSNKLQTCKKL
jgi:hypothetical protein